MILWIKFIEYYASENIQNRQKQTLTVHTNILVKSMFHEKRLTFFFSNDFLFNSDDMGPLEKITIKHYKRQIISAWKQLTSIWLDMFSFGETQVLTIKKETQLRDSLTPAASLLFLLKHGKNGKLNIFTHNSFIYLYYSYKYVAMASILLCIVVSWIIKS